MRRCLKCQATYPATEPRLPDVCPNCGSVVEVRDGLVIYAPDLTDESEGFKAEYFDELARLEGRNFWFRARNRIIQDMFADHMPSDGEMLEIGCGNGFVLRGLRTAFPNAILMGSEIFLNGLRNASALFPEVPLMQMDARDIPYSEHFDAIGAFDVLEHIEADGTVLAQTFKALKPGGHLIVTVPQHMFLWSPLDEYAHHFRRYARGEIERKMLESGFEVRRSTSFVTLLLPAMVVSRLIKKITSMNNLNSNAELRINPVLNTLFFWVMMAESFLIRLGINLPFGGSRLVVARKPSIGPSMADAE